MVFVETILKTENLDIKFSNELKDHLNEWFIIERIDLKCQETKIKLKKPVWVIDKIEKYLECYWDKVEKNNNIYIAKQLWTKIERALWYKIISAIVKETDNTYKVIRDFI